MAIFDITYVGDMPYLKLEGGTVTGVTTFTNNIAASTINGVTVGSDPKFTDTTYSVATTSANGLLSSTDKTAVNKIGSGSLNTTSQTLIGAVNELFGQLKGVEITHVIKSTSSAKDIYHELYSSPDKAIYIIYSPGGGSWMHLTNSTYSSSDMHAGIANGCGYRPWAHYGWSSGYSGQANSDPYLRMNSGSYYYETDSIAYLRGDNICYFFPTHDTPNDFVLYGWHTANNNPYGLTYDFYVIKIPIVS